MSGQPFDIANAVAQLKNFRELATAKIASLNIQSDNPNYGLIKTAMGYLDDLAGFLEKAQHGGDQKELLKKVQGYLETAKALAASYGIDIEKLIKDRLPKLEL